MGRPFRGRSVAFAVIAAVVTGRSPHVRAQAVPPAEQPQYDVLAKGAVARTVASLQLQSADLRLDVRNIVIGPDRSEAFPAPARAIMELRSGGVVTTIDGKEQDRRIGDFWTVEKGSVIRVKNLAPASVIREIYLYEGSR